MELRIATRTHRPGFPSQLCLCLLRPPSEYWTTVFFGVKEAILQRLAPGPPAQLQQDDVGGSCAGSLLGKSHGVRPVPQRRRGTPQGAWSDLGCGTRGMCSPEGCTNKVWRASPCIHVSSLGILRPGTCYNMPPASRKRAASFLSWLPLDQHRIQSNRPSPTEQSLYQRHQRHFLFTQGSLRSKLSSLDWLQPLSGCWFSRCELPGGTEQHTPALSLQLTLHN